jgi:hypothetical protein
MAFRLFGVTPTPAGTATTPVTVGPGLVLVMIVASFYIHDRFVLPLFNPAPQPAPSALVAEAKTYIAGYPAVFKAVGDGIASKSLTKKSQVIAELAKHSDPLAKELDSSFGTFVDPKDRDTISNPSRAAALFHQVATSLGGK